ncbi:MULTISPECIES: peptidoglycan-binding protein [Geobacillus]|uniref:C40 family peptidase n=1 Tax=Geobacillus TaxID=129337 RepID=UPI0003F50375|nr:MULTISPECIES: peptidoglycan-binding protein [Geobacillus]AOL35823.1 peptidase P60 [Geobacillus thermoleovorans]WMJ19778.1 peptidoglycan-binding protein [Geobacillus kaustophilus]GAJ57385.1 cell wall lytic activity [Geobacillus thermoleovorans B23]
MKPNHVVFAAAMASAFFLAPDESQAAEWKKGMSSPEIKQLQQRLKEKGFFTYPQATGYFGAITEEAVKAFQRAMNLPATGIVDDATYAKLKSAPASNDTLAIGSRGAAVSDLQRRLKQLGYFRYPQITGYYGAVTADAVKQFQRANGLPATGRADRATLERLKQKATSQPATSSDALTIGSRGDDVRKLQQQLKQLGYFTYSDITGYYGVLTADAVRRFQRDNGLPVTGAVDNQTAARLASAVKAKTNPPATAERPAIRLSIGSRGEDVKRVQKKLKELGYFTYPTITGYYGTVTADAVRRFQQSVKLPVTGVVDSETYERLLGQAPPTKVDVIELVADAAELLGTPYVWGGDAPEEGFDCSGFIFYLFQQQGVPIPRTVALMWNAGVSVSAPEVGDIVFFATTTNGPSHAGIYIGNGQFIHSGASTGVTISQLNNPYWKARYLGAKRYS